MPDHMRQGFDNDKYIELQAANIRRRIDQFGGKLYLEFGGKLFDDYHASRVLPGFEPDTKFRMLESMAADVEIVIATNANHIQQGKTCGDLGIPYDEDVLRLIDVFRSRGFHVGTVVLAQYAGQPAADAYRHRLEQLGVTCRLHYPFAGYPHDIEHIVSDDGYGRNEYIETTRPLVVVTAPGPGSGKLATCLSQLYHEHKRGINAGYAKYETFPIWNLPLNHPVNIAYEAATADLDDTNIIDPFHLEAHGETTVNYNRDVEAFPVLKAMMERIMGESPYQSPTDMGVNMAGYAIVDDDACRDAARLEIVRRYFTLREPQAHRQRRGADRTTPFHHEEGGRRPGAARHPRRGHRTDLPSQDGAPQQHEPPSALRRDAHRAVHHQRDGPGGQARHRRPRTAARRRRLLLRYHLIHGRGAVSQTRHQRVLRTEVRTGESVSPVNATDKRGMPRIVKPVIMQHAA